MSNKTGDINRITGIYKTVCHPKERTILNGQQFPCCGACNHDATWILVRREAGKTTRRDSANCEK